MTAAGDSRSANGGRARLPDWAPALGFLLAAGIVLGLFGPFGTYQALAPAARIAYWLGAVLAIGGTTMLIHRLVVAGLGAWIGWAGAVVLSAALSAIPGTAFILLLNLAVPEDGFPLSPPLLFAQVLLVNLSLTFLGAALARRRASVESPRPGTAAPREPSPDARWRERLPPELRAAALLALEAEDHYLRVHTASGVTLILLRLGDAIAELGATRGLQVHRSFWVARDAVERVERSGEKVTLVLRGGLRVPVSRGNRAKLAAMGWS